MKKLLSILLVVVLLFGGGGYLLATGANASVPGDALYAVDLLAEDVQRALTFNDMSRAELEQSILEERAEEIDTLLENAADDAVLGEAVSNLELQRVRTETKLLTLLNEDSNYDSTKFEEVRLRYENTVRTQVQKMTNWQEKYQNIGSQTKKGFEEAVETLSTLEISGGAGNQEQNADTGDAGDGIKDRESNSDEDTGNDPKGTSSQTGR